MAVLRWKQMVSTVLEKLSTVPEDGLGDEERESCDENERGRDSIVEAEVEFMAYVKHLKEQYGAAALRHAVGWNMNTIVPQTSAYGNGFDLLRSKFRRQLAPH